MLYAQKDPLITELMGRSAEMQRTQTLMHPSSLRLLYRTARSTRHRCSCSAGGGLAFFSTTHDTKREKNANQFLTRGFQPSEITGDNLGFYYGSTFFEGEPPGPLPVLDLSVIL